MYYFSELAHPALNFSQTYLTLNNYLIMTDVKLEMANLRKNNYGTVKILRDIVPNYDLQFAVNKNLICM